MFTRIGRKLIQGAKAEIQESPPDILNPERFAEIAETVLTFGLLAATLFLGGRANKHPVTVIVNNYIQK